MTITCQQCGQTSPPGSRFCNWCGAALSSASIAPAPAREPTTDEQIVFVIRPAMIFVLIRYLLAAVVTVGMVVGYFYLDDRFPGAIPWWVVLVASTSAFASPIYRHILRQREVYTLTTTRMEFSYGILSKVRRSIPLSKIQDVTVTRTALERLIGIGDIVIDSAVESGRIPLRNIAHPERYADLILRQIEHR